MSFAATVVSLVCDSAYTLNRTSFAKLVVQSQFYGKNLIAILLRFVKILERCTYFIGFMETE